jgi:hypothetical protein
VLSVLTLLCWNVLFAVCGLPALAVCWLLKRTGFIRKIPG